MKSRQYLPPAVAVLQPEPVLLRLRAEAENNPSAQYMLGMIYQRGIGVRQDYAIASEWFRRSAMCALLGHADRPHAMEGAA